jgi:hypothetical protein
LTEEDIMSAFRWITAVCAMAACLAGCGKQNGLLEVQGAVSYKNQPVQKGTISFLPADGNAPTAAGIITDGRFAVKVAPGKKQVKIESFKVVGRRHLHAEDPKSPMIDVREQLLPDRYNKKTELVREVTSGGVCDFTLE